MPQNGVKILMQDAINIAELSKKRVLVLDGAMGTAIQQRNLAPEDFTFPGLPAPVPGCNEVLSVSRPDVIEAIHTAYIDAGADIIETNTFNGTPFSLKDYGLEDKAYELNLAAAKVARKAIEKAGRQVFSQAPWDLPGARPRFHPPWMIRLTACRNLMILLTPIASS